VVVGGGGSRGVDDRNTPGGGGDDAAAVYAIRQGVGHRRTRHNYKRRIRIKTVGTIARNRLLRQNT